MSTVNDESVDDELGHDVTGPFGGAKPDVVDVAEYMA
jgi:hypothetical protein